MRSDQLAVVVALILTGCAGADGGGGTPDGAPPGADAEPEVDAAPRPDAPPAPDAAIDAGVVSADDLPHIDDYSDSPPEHVVGLVRAALDGLGFDPSLGEGPSPKDRVFVGKHYLAWIDQTGFYGKMNGLWTLNGKSGTELDFVLKDPDGRPVNFFVVGENGDGAWPSGYKGAEHLEFPNRTPEINDNPSCATGDWCNQYGLNEAVPYTNPKIQHWSSCNVGLGPASFAVQHNPVVVQEIDGGLKLVYEGNLTKEADGGDGVYDGDGCHLDYLFPDGVRRTVKLRVGYELYADFPSFDRTLQLVNPPGNPTLVGDMSMIGGFVTTAWPTPHYLKGLDRYWRPEVADLVLKWGSENIPLVHGVWTFLATRSPSSSDVLVSWADQPISLSAANGYAAGRTATLAHVGEIDNGDVGACLCTVHGGLEMGGGLLHKDVSLPIEAGQSTKEARRRLTIPSSGNLPAPFGFVYQGEGPELSHKTGRKVDDGWEAATGPDGSNHMAYGPYATNWGGGTGQAVFYLMVDVVDANNDKVVTVDIRDDSTGDTIASRDIYRHEFAKPGTYQKFVLEFRLLNRVGHRMETRVDWHDVSYVKLDKIVVNLIE